MSSVDPAIPPATNSAAPGSGSSPAAAYQDAPSRWHIYDGLIARIPEEVEVTRPCLGYAWSYVEAECGMGVAMTVRGGVRSRACVPRPGQKLRAVAQLCKSWNFTEATLGMAALNAWYSRREALEQMGAVFDQEGTIDDPDYQRKADGFAVYGPQMKGKNVCVIGHFPHVERIATQHGGRLTVLERNISSDIDLPDPACEYVIPEMDYLFMTGITLTNKTATRLLELARMSGRTHTIMIGPSAVPSPDLMRDQKIECVAGSIVQDPGGVRALVERGEHMLFGDALAMFHVSLPLPGQAG